MATITRTEVQTQNERPQTVIMSYGPGPDQQDDIRSNARNDVYDPKLKSEVEFNDIEDADGNPQINKKVVSVREKIKKTKRVNITEDDVYNASNNTLQSGYRTRPDNEIGVPPIEITYVKTRTEDKRSFKIDMDTINDSMFRYSAGYFEKCPETIRANESIQTIGGPDLAPLKKEYYGSRGYGYRGYIRDKINDEFFM